MDNDEQHERGKRGEETDGSHVTFSAMDKPHTICGLPADVARYFGIVTFSIWVLTNSLRKMSFFAAIVWPILYFLTKDDSQRPKMLWESFWRPELMDPGKPGKKGG